MSGYEKMSNFSMREPLYIPPEATHVLKIMGRERLLKVRKFHGTYLFSEVTMDVLYVPCNTEYDRIYDRTFSSYQGIELSEFLHYIVPNQNIIIEYLPVNSFIYDDDTPDRTRLIELSGDCSCTNTTRKCIFHDFLCESLYSKYKNNVVAKAPNSNSNYDDSWSLDQFVP